ncbi:MAG: hypothetical protein WCW30_01670 [Candidatus Gracilibacteria bacterium]
MNFTHWNKFLSFNSLAGSEHACIYLEVPQKWVKTEGEKVTSTTEAKQYAGDLKEVYSKEKLTEIQKTYTKEKLAELRRKVEEEGGAADLNSFDAKGGKSFEVDKPEYAGKGLLEILAMESPLLNAAFEDNHALKDVSYMHVFQKLEEAGLDANVVLMKTAKRKQGTIVQLEKGVVTVTQLVFGTDGKQKFTPDGKPETKTATCTLFPDIFGGSSQLQPKMEVPLKESTPEQDEQEKTIGEIEAHIESKNKIYPKVGATCVVTISPTDGSRSWRFQTLCNDSTCGPNESFVIDLKKNLEVTYQEIDAAFERVGNSPQKEAPSPVGSGPLDEPPTVYPEPPSEEETVAAEKAAAEKAAVEQAAAEKAEAVKVEPVKTLESKEADPQEKAWEKIKAFVADSLNMYPKVTASCIIKEPEDGKPRSWEINVSCKGGIEGCGAPEKISLDLVKNPNSKSYYDEIMELLNRVGNPPKPKDPDALVLSPYGKPKQEPKLGDFLYKDSGNPLLEAADKATVGDGDWKKVYKLYEKKAEKTEPFSPQEWCAAVEAAMHCGDPRNADKIARKAGKAIRENYRNSSLSNEDKKVVELIKYYVDTIEKGWGIQVLNDNGFGIKSVRPREESSLNFFGQAALKRINERIREGEIKKGITIMLPAGVYEACDAKGIPTEIFHIEAGKIPNVTIRGAKGEPEPKRVRNSSAK